MAVFLGWTLLSVRLLVCASQGELWSLPKYQILRGNLGCGFLTLSWCSCLLQMCLKMFSIKTLRVTEISIHSPSFSDGGLSVHVVLWAGEVWFPVISSQMK